MKRSVAVALLFLFPLALSAQQINEVIEVNVVEIEVVVLDSHGKPVPGLTKDDFEVREGGKKREITNFYAVDHGEIHYDAPAAPLPATTSAEPPPAPIPAPPLHYVIYVDNAHLDLKQRNRVLDSLRKFINDHLKDGADASLIVFNHEAKVRVSFTTDRTKLFAAVDEMEHESARAIEMLSARRALIRRIDDVKMNLSKEEPDQVFRAVLVYCEDQTHDVTNAMNGMIEAMQRVRGVSGHKVLVHVSSGLPLQPGIEMVDYWAKLFGDPAVTNITGLQYDQTKKYKEVVDAAQNAGATIYTIDAAGLAGSEDADITIGNPLVHLDSTLMRENRRQPLNFIAEETGGRLITNENDFDVAFNEIHESTTTYYSLGIRGDGSNKLHNVDVRVKKPGLVARNARAFRERNTDEVTREAVESALDFPRTDNPLGVTLNVQPVKATGVKLAIGVAPSHLVVLDQKAHVRYYAVVRDAGGGKSPLRVLDQSLSPIDAFMNIGMKLHSGKYTLSLAVRDLNSNDTSYVQKTFSVE